MGVGCRVCVCERERKRERARGNERERGRGRGNGRAPSNFDEPFALRNKLVHQRVVVRRSFGHVVSEGGVGPGLSDEIPDLGFGI